MQEIKTRKQIAKVIRKKLTEKSYKKTDLAKNTGVSRHVIYKIIQRGGRDENYSFDSLMVICKELDVKLFFY